MMVYFPSPESIDAFGARAMVSALLRGGAVSAMLRNLISLGYRISNSAVRHRCNRAQ